MTTRRLFPVALVFAAALPVFAQSEAKGIYVDGAKPAMKFNVVLNREGDSHPVATTYTFHTGDKMKFQFDVTKDSYIYVLHRTINGDSSTVDRYAGTRGIEIIRDDDRKARGKEVYDLLYPRAKEGNLVKAHTLTSVPSRREDYFRMDENPGMEKLMVIASPRPIHIEDYFDVASGKLKKEGTRRPQNDSDDDINSRLAKSLLEFSGNSITDTDSGARGIDRVDGYAGPRAADKPIVVMVDLRHVSNR